ncbi:DUF4880 domain-containing protein [Xinfangfangia sp. D13-10-4-6]|uniref:FecR family protein n=1 Tax=Pseudogemmobacter hezensis TaxID=2737662 RepID=UPI001555A02B|nr:FecR domain-containing protein [Pseudogemmobacter hezensis]NPD16983.1 DUF4880 domain-containing protein [Pseudogemmobacter hezensis]
MTASVPPASPGPGASHDPAATEEAADWLIRITADPAEKDSAAFQAWHGDQANARAFARASNAWDIAALVGPDLAAELAEEFDIQAEAAPRPARRPRNSRRWSLLWPGGVALAASLLGAVWLDMVRPDLRRSLSADHTTAPGELLDFALSDGSRALLDGGSALDFVADTVSRQVTVLAGAAWFDVTKDGRPFTVRLGETEIRALGTRFGVRDCGTCLEVTLEEGSVEVTAPGHPPVIMQPGQQLRLVPGRPAQILGLESPEALAWREGRYVFYDAPLREVAGVLSRHGAGAVLFTSEALAERRISGSIRLDTAQDELQAMAEAMGFQILPLPGGSLLR